MVVAIDHPRDANVDAFPDGHTVSIGKVGESENAISNALVDRIADTGYVLGALLGRPRRLRRTRAMARQVAAP